MKQIALGLAATLTLFACSSNTPKNAEEFDAKMNEMFKEYELACQAAEEQMSGEELQKKVQEISDNLEDKVKVFSKEVISKTKDSELALHVFTNYYYIFDAEENIKMVESMPADAQNDEKVQKIKKASETQLLTSAGNMFIDFEADGVKFSDFIGKGKYMLVDFWASWCGPCKREIPNIKAVYEKYAGENFDVLSVAVWDKPEDTAKAAAEHGVVWNQMINTGNAATDAYGIAGIPQIMLFGPDGKIVKRDLREGGIEEAVKEALGK